MEDDSMKKTILFLGILATTVVGGFSVQASEDPEALFGGGMEARNGVTPDDVVPQARYAAGGGDFACGVNGFKVWARYDHSRRTHSATAKNGWGGSVRDKQGAGRRAYATANATLSGNTGWWNVY